MKIIQSSSSSRLFNIIFGRNIPRKYFCCSKLRRDSGWKIFNTRYRIAGTECVLFFRSGVTLKKRWRIYRRSATFLIIVSDRSYSWVIIAEIFPPHLKSFCSAFTTSFCWFLCFIVTKFFSKYSELIGMSASFYSFVIVCVVALFFCIFQLPDTQGRSFQEIQDLIHGTEEKTEKCKRRLFSL